MRERAIICLLVLMAAAPEKPKEKENDVMSKTDKELLQGDWQEVSREGGGKAEDPGFSTHFTWTFAGDKLHFLGDRMTPGADIEMRFTLRPEKKPKEIDMTITRTPDQKNIGDTQVGIYELDGDKLKLCYDTNSRPSEFKTKKGDQKLLVILKRRRAEPPAK